MACHVNGIALLRHVSKVYVEMMDIHIIPKLPVYAESLAKHAGCWDVYQLIVTHRWDTICAGGLQCDVPVERYLPLIWSGSEGGAWDSKVHNVIPENIKCGAMRVMPGKYDAQNLAQRTLQDLLANIYKIVGKSIRACQ